jgi:hypothetical protein
LRTLSISFAGPISPEAQINTHLDKTGTATAFAGATVTQTVRSEREPKRCLLAQGSRRSKFFHRPREIDTSFDESPVMPY